MPLLSLPNNAPFDAYLFLTGLGRFEPFFRQPNQNPPEVLLFF